MGGKKRRDEDYDKILIDVIAWIKKNNSGREMNV